MKLLIFSLVAASKATAQIISPVRSLVETEGDRQLQGIHPCDFYSTVSKCDCVRTTEIRSEVTCVNPCESCHPVLDACVDFTLINERYNFLDNTHLSTYFKIEYEQSGADIFPGVFSYEEGFLGCSFFVNGARCDSCVRQNTVCSLGRIIDCTNIDGVDAVFDSCTDFPGLDSPFYAYDTFDDSECLAEDETAAPSSAPTKAPTGGIPPKKVPPPADSKDDGAKLFASLNDIGRGGLTRKVRKHRGR